MLHMFNTYVATIYSKCFSYWNLMLQQVISCCKFQVFYPDIVYVFTHVLQVHVPNVSLVSDVCCKCFIWMLHML
jgi:hypothetical protein